jgi:CheY-like chemotaxis protein
MVKIPDFILFDDDPVNNTLCHITIKNIYKDAKIKTFTIPEKGYQYISEEFLFNRDKETVIFLDINLKGMTCWDFLEKFEMLDGKIKTKFKIYILSASLDPADKERASADKNVTAFLEKPLTIEKVRNII